MTICPNSKAACECQPQDGVMCPHGPTPNDWPKPFDSLVTVPRGLLLKAAALLSERAPCADPGCHVSDDGAVMRCYDELCAAARLPASS